MAAAARRAAVFFPRSQTSFGNVDRRPWDCPPQISISPPLQSKTSRQFRPRPASLREWRFRTRWKRFIGTTRPPSSAFSSASPAAKHNKSRMAAFLLGELATVDPQSRRVFPKVNLDLQHQILVERARWDAIAPWNIWYTIHAP